MSAPLIALFVIGIAMGLILQALKPEQPAQPKIQRPINKSDKLDTVDEMYLFGEATNDDFYRM